MKFIRCTKTLFDITSANYNISLIYMKKMWEMVNLTPEILTTNKNIPIKRIMDYMDKSNAIIYLPINKVFHMIYMLF